MPVRGGEIVDHEIEIGGSRGSFYGGNQHEMGATAKLENCEVVSIGDASHAQLDHEIPSQRNVGRRECNVTDPDLRTLIGFSDLSSHDPAT